MCFDWRYRKPMMTTCFSFAMQWRKQMMVSADRLAQYPNQYRLHETRFSRRELLLGAGAAALTSVPNRASHAQAALQPADHTIRIAPISLEIAPNKVIRTTGYNGKVPGPPLRLREGKPVTLNVVNDSGYPNLIHWLQGSRCFTALRPSRPAQGGTTATPWR
jgi:hypothetical protein